MRHNISEEYCILWTAGQKQENESQEKKKKQQTTDGNLSIQMEQIVFIFQISEKIQYLVEKGDKITT